MHLSSNTPGDFRRRDDVTWRNDAVAANARRYRFDPETRLPLICECDDYSCTEFVRISLEGYDHARDRGAFIVAPHHPFEGRPTDGLRRDDYELYLSARNSRSYLTLSGD